MRLTLYPRAINARPSRSKKVEIGPCRNRKERSSGADALRSISNSAQLPCPSMSMPGRKQIPDHGRNEGKFPAAGNFLVPAPGRVGFFYSGQRLGGVSLRREQGTRRTRTAT